MWETRVRSLGWEDSPGEGNGNPLQYSCLENPMDEGAWWATVHEVAKCQTRLSDSWYWYHSHSYPTPEARGSGQEELPQVQGVVAALAQEGQEELL